jgi:hypothetical protein
MAEENPESSIDRVHLISSLPKDGVAGIALELASFMIRLPPIKGQSTGFVNANSVGKLAHSRGEWLGLCRMYFGTNVSIVELAPRTWQKVIPASFVGETKKRVRAYLESLPSMNYNEFLFTKRGRYRDGIGDALAMGLFAVKEKKI